MDLVGLARLLSSDPGRAEWRACVLVGQVSTCLFVPETADGTPLSRTNFGVYPNHLANSWMGNQYYFVVENPLNQVDYVNFGYRFDTLFGNDWQFTKSYGLFDRAFPTNHFAGVDLPQIYGEVHLPILTPRGLDVCGGRFYSLNGFESPQAIARPLLSVPYMLNFKPFTFFGAIATLHLNDRMNLFSGTINGFDRGIDQYYRWGYIGDVLVDLAERKSEPRGRGRPGERPAPQVPADPGSPPDVRPGHRGAALQPALARLDRPRRPARPLHARGPFRHRLDGHRGLRRARRRRLLSRHHAPPDWVRLRDPFQSVSKKAFGFTTTVTATPPTSGKPPFAARGGDRPASRGVERVALTSATPYPRRGTELPPASSQAGREQPAFFLESPIARKGR